MTIRNKVREIMCLSREEKRRLNPNANSSKKRAWELVASQGKSLPMNILMLYMFGNTIQIYSMTMILMLIRGAFKAIFSIGSGSPQE